MTETVPHTVGALLINPQGEVLLGLRAAWKTAWPEHWDSIGGRLEPGETLDQCMIREVGEEVGVRPTAFRLLEAMREQRPDLYPDGLHHIYAVTAWEGEATNACDEHIEIRWFPVEALGDLPHLIECDLPRLARLARGIALGERA
jgi:8-oxo-dGTP diphosphatase